MEPWVNLKTGVDFSNWKKNDEIQLNQKLRQETKYWAFCNFFDMINENGISGDYFEFGCHRVRTFRMALTEARVHDLNTLRFLAFDSFEGLPQEGVAESKHKIWKAGALSTSEAEFKRIINAHGIYTDKVRTIKGFYSQSLTNNLSNELIAENYSAALVNVDCDIYESALDVFKFLPNFLKEGSIIYVDDYFAGYKSNPEKGVGLALTEFKSELAKKT